jgi:pimeloyl-ACP methyl ester carboxylesterase
MARSRLLLPTVFMVVGGVLTLANLRLPDTPPPVTHYAFGHGPTVVLVHGPGGRMQHWLPVARLLARDHHVVLVELPGHGESVLPVPLTLERSAVTLDAALQDLGGEPVVLVGHSVGGLVCVAAALTHPRQVRGLVLVETALEPQLTASERDGLLDSLIHGLDRLLRARYLAMARDSAQGERLYAEAAGTDPRTLRAWAHLAGSTDLSGAGRLLSMPSLAVLSDRTWRPGEEWPVVAATLGYEDVPRLSVQRIDGCGHFIMLDRPEELARAIGRFTAATTAGGAEADATAANAAR